MLETIIWTISIILFVLFVLFVWFFTGVLSSTKIDSQSGNPDLKLLKGKRGLTKTDLRPTGIARIGGKNIRCTTDATFLSKGTKVRVVEVSENKVVVEEVE